MNNVLVPVCLAGALFASSAALCQSRDKAIATGIDFDMDFAVAPAVQKYSDCLATRRPMVINGDPTQTIATETAISACKATRAAAMAEANDALAAKPGWESITKRNAEVTSDFDNTDASARKIARETDAYFGRVNH
jgi:hypothetical protein